MVNKHFTITSFILALALNTAVFLLLTVTFRLPAKNAEPILASKLVKAYIYSPPVTQLQRLNKTSTKENSNKNAKKLSQQNKQYDISKNKLTLSSNETLASTDRKVNNASELLQLLHAAIQTQQHYPHDALVLGRKGTVSIAFDLFPDGHLENLKIINSSGTISIDNAALTAVKAAAPFKAVNNYLHEAHLFTIQVVFD